MHWNIETNAAISWLSKHCGSKIQKEITDFSRVQGALIYLQRSAVMIDQLTSGRQVYCFFDRSKLPSTGIWQ